VKTWKGKSRFKRGRRFHYNSEKITIIAAWFRALGFWGWLIVPLLLKGVYYLYRWLSYWIRLKSSHLFEHLFYLNYLSWMRLEPNILIWIGRARICHYSIGSIRLPIWLIYSRAVTVGFKWRFGLKIWVLVTDYISILWLLEMPEV